MSQLGPPMPVSDQALTLPIPTAARHLADQFSAQQPTPEKAEQVRFNTLAVWVVHDYLQMMGVPCDLHASDSWNPVIRACNDVADLKLSSAGRIECRPVQADDNYCHLPPETWDDRVGYLVVQFESELRQAKLLGFTPTAAECLPLQQQQPIESLLAHLSEFSLAPVPCQEGVLHHIEQWLGGIFAEGWQTVEALLGEAEPAFNFRRAESDDVVGLPAGQVQRAKLIDLSPALPAPVVLVVDCQPSTPLRRLFCVQVHPLASGACLPEHLYLSIADEGSPTLLSVQSRQADDYIQLQFSGYPGEAFSVAIAFEDMTFTEQFVV